MLVRIASGTPNEARWLGIEAPPDTGSVDPLGDVVELVVIESEPLPDRPESQEVEDGGCLEPTADQFDEGDGGAQHRVGGPDRLVGDPVPQGRCAASRRRSRAGAGATRLGRRSEDGLDQRGERLDGRADHQDVVFDETGARIVQQVQSASRSTSTWRVAPKQAWNCTERSAGS